MHEQRGKRIANSGTRSTSTSGILAVYAVVSRIRIPGDEGSRVIIILFNNATRAASAGGLPARTGAHRLDPLAVGIPRRRKEEEVQLVSSHRSLSSDAKYPRNGALHAAHDTRRACGNAIPYVREAQPPPFVFRSWSRLDEEIDTSTCIVSRPEASP